MELLWESSEIIVYKLRSAVWEGQLVRVDDAYVEVVKAFRRLERVHHLNVCPVLSITESDGIVDVRMKSYERTISDFLDLHHYISEANVKIIGYQIARALQKIHEAGLVLRDVSCDSVFLEEEHVILNEFKSLRRSSDEPFEDPAGWTEYMSPEMIMGSYSSEIDWWQFGILLYEMLVGVPPFEGIDVEDISDCILLEEPIYPVEMSRQAKILLKALLDKNLESRLVDGNEILKHPFFA
eukprot:TRINITY_DN7588_c0_g1_i1.p1 TRINITY_DN7588_c0_g1~~TRINITY_DN7588_c0_g1_i1.p1  ORF type:complete len:239 (+),score=43.70 TRINITY_DN7588_c0_g1_i1:91-807(+)